VRDMSRFPNSLESGSSNFRLRLGNEELALAPGVTLIGREPTCRITIFDTLISRRHARIQCDGTLATIEDLGSRNGTRVNGVPISRPHTLREGDRVGIGSHELLVTIVSNDDSELFDTPTNVHTICPDCRVPFASNGGPCPSCGSTRAAAESGSQRSEDTSRGRWSLGMLVEMLGRAKLMESAAEAEKLMRQAALLVDERHAPLPDSDELRALTEVSTWLSRAQQGKSLRPGA
jgi:pSer/pThr/pTyr-binding forkhead associated (FHA) protein